MCACSAPLPLVCIHRTEISKTSNGANLFHGWRFYQFVHNWGHRSVGEAVHKVSLFTCSLLTGLQLHDTLLHWPVHAEEEAFINPKLGRFATMAVLTWCGIGAATVASWGLQTCSQVDKVPQPICARNPHSTRARGPGQSRWFLSASRTQHNHRRLHTPCLNNKRHVHWLQDEKKLSDDPSRWLYVPTGFQFVWLHIKLLQLPAAALSRLSQTFKHTQLIIGDLKESGKINKSINTINRDVSSYTIQTLK